MKRLLTVKEMADRYRCSEKTARRYMRQMEQKMHVLLLPRQMKMKRQYWVNRLNVKLYLV